MKQTLPPSGGGSPERGTTDSIEGGENEKEFQKIGHNIFLEVSSLMDSIKPSDPFEWYFTQGSASNIIRRTAERLVLDSPKDFSTRIKNRPIYLQSDQEIDEGQKNEAKIQNYIRSYSRNPYFDHGFRRIQDFVKGLGPYLDGSGTEPQEAGNPDGQVTIGRIKMTVAELTQHRATDPRGYSLVKLVAQRYGGEPADEKTRAGMTFGETFFLQACVDIIGAGKDYPTLKKLLRLHPGGRPADWNSKLSGL